MINLIYCLLRFLLCSSDLISPVSKAPHLVIVWGRHLSFISVNETDAVGFKAEQDVSYFST